MSKRAKKKTAIEIISVGLIVLLSASSLWGMTAKKVIENMEQACKKQTKDIEDMTIFNKLAGGMAMLAGESITYQKRARIDGKTIYKIRNETKIMGKTMVTIYDGIYNWSIDPASGEVKKKKAEFTPDPTRLWRNLKPSETHYLGTEEIEGEKAHLLKIDNPFKVVGKPSTKALQEGESSAEGKIWVNAGNWTLMRTLMVISGKSKEGKETIIKINMELKDYRSVNGMLFPYRMTTTTEIDMPGLSEEEKQMMQSFMGVMGSYEIITTDVKVNNGLSDDLFDGTKLKPGKSMFQIPMPQS